MSDNITRLVWKPHGFSPTMAAAMALSKTGSVPSPSGLRSTWQWTSAADRPAAHAGLRDSAWARDQPLSERSANRRPCRDFAERRPLAPAFLQAVSRADGLPPTIFLNAWHGARDRPFGRGTETVSEIGLISALRPRELLAVLHRQWRRAAERLPAQRRAPHGKRGAASKTDVRAREKTFGKTAGTSSTFIPRGEVRPGSCGRSEMTISSSAPVWS